MRFTAIKVFTLCILVLLLAVPALAQNTKGDRPAPAPRETRFKTPKQTKPTRRPSRRARKGDDRPSKIKVPPPPRSKPGERAGKPLRPQFSPSQPGKTERAWRGDVTNRRISPRTATSRAKNVYPQPETINYSSHDLKRRLRQNENPNVKRVRKMQRSDGDKPRVGKPIRPTFHKTRPQHRERAWRGDITGRRIRAGSSDRLRPGISQGPGRVSGIPPRTRARRFGMMPSRITGRARNVFSQKSFYVNNESYRRRPVQSQRTRWALGMLNRHNRRSKARGAAERILPRSASASYLSRRSINVWAHFKRPQRRTEQAYTRDIAGKRLRTKNFETQRPVLINPTLNYQRRMARGERPYKGPAAGSHVSRTRSGRAWRGDIAHRAIRGGFRSKKGEPRAGVPILAKRPGGDYRRMGKFQGNLRRKGFSEQGEEYTGNIRRGRRLFQDQGEEYAGNIRFRKPAKGGGSVSGGWNNKGQPIQGRVPGKGAGAIGYSGNIKAGKRGFQDQGEEYAGNIRARRPAKGGGSISGGWNNKGQPIQGRVPGKGADAIGYSGNIKAGRRGFEDQGEEYAGNIKTRRPEKGGGSISGHWNNKGLPIPVRTPKGEGARGVGYSGNIRAGRRVFEDQGEEYAGNIKARRPEKGGGSVSGKLWNNNERPIEGRAYAGHTKVSRYSGNIKAKRPEKGGGSVSGKLWNNNETPIEGRSYAGTTKISRYSGNVKVRKDPKGSEGDDFGGNVKVARGDYKRNPNANANALPGLRASATTLKAGRHTSGVRRDWGYVRNPSSADEAQRTREPGRAFARSTDFHGNIRVKKFDLFKKSDLHPDAQFVRINRNNVPEEKDVVTNFKLWWARLFRKAETQPDHLKENNKDRKPRYDKGEAGLWYD